MRRIILRIALLITLIAPCLYAAAIDYTVTMIDSVMDIEDMLTAEGRLLEEGEPVEMGEHDRIYHARIEFSSHIDDNQIVWIDQPWLDKCTAYFFDSKSHCLDQAYLGYDIPVLQRPYLNQHYMFEIPKNTSWCILELQSCESLVSRVIVDSKYRIIKKQARLNYGFGFYTGLVVLTIVYGVLMFLIYRRRWMAAYTLYIASVLMAQSIVFGFDYVFIRNNTFIAIEPASIFIPFVVLAARSLIISLFQIKRKSLLHRISTGIALIAFAGLVLRIFEIYHLAVTCINVSAGLMSLMIISLAVSKNREFERAEQLVMLALTIFATGAAIFNLKNLGLIPSNPFTELAMISGSSIETFILALAIYRKTKDLRKSRDRIQVMSTMDSEQYNSFKSRLIVVEQEYNEYKFRAIVNALNPHFAFNALSSLKSCIENKEYATATEFIDRFAVVMRNYLFSTEYKSAPIEYEVAFLKSYLELEKMRMKGRLTYEIRVDDSIDQQLTFVPTAIVQPILENAIIHGIKHRNDDQGKVILSYIRDSVDLVIKVEDNGVGINKSKEINKHLRANHKSYAMELIRKRLKMESKESRCGLFIESTDDVGTTVTIRIPFPEAGDYDEYLDLMDFE